MVTSWEARFRVSGRPAAAAVVPTTSRMVPPFADEGGISALIYKWGFSEPRFGQHPGQKRCALNIVGRDIASHPILRERRSAGRRAGDERDVRHALEDLDGIRSTTLHDEDTTSKWLATSARSGPGGPTRAPVASSGDRDRSATGHSKTT
jgi:hypothetical protein